MTLNSGLSAEVVRFACNEVVVDSSADICLWLNEHERTWISPRNAFDPFWGTFIDKWVFVAGRGWSDNLPRRLRR